MTKEKAKELSVILKAYSESKTIQILCYGKDGAQDAYFRDLKYDSELHFLTPDESLGNKFRIKPEPKLVPFTIEDKDLFLGKIIKHRRSNLFNIIVGASQQFIWVGGVVKGFNYMELWEMYEFEDGSPCGKYVE